MSARLSVASEAPSSVTARALAILHKADAVVMGSVRGCMVLLLTLMACVVFANVLVRYTQWGALVWAEEVARYAMIWLTFLGIGPVLRIGGHIAIDALQHAVPRPAARAVRGLILLLMATLAASMVVLGWQYMERTQYQLTASTQISFRYVYAAMPVGGLVFLWCLAAVAIGFVTQGRFDPHVSDVDHGQGVQL